MAAVHDGYVLRKSVISHPVGGQLLSQCMQASVQQRGLHIKPRFFFRRVETSLGKWEVRLQLSGLGLHRLSRDMGAASFGVRGGLLPPVQCM